MGADLKKTLAKAMAGDPAAASYVREAATFSANPAERAQWGPAWAQVQAAHPAAAAGALDVNAGKAEQSQSLLSKIGHGVGSVGQIAAPLLAATGVGIPLAAGIGGASALLKGQGLKGAVLGAGSAALGGLAGKALGTTGLLGKLGSKLGIGGGGGLPSSIGVPTPDLSGVPSGLGGDAPGGGGLLGKIGSGLGSLFGGKNTLGTLGNLAQLGVAGAGTVAGANQYAKAGKLQDQRLAQAQAQQADRDLLRKQAIGKLSAPIAQRPDLGSLFAGSQNPFARRPMMAA